MSQETATLRILVPWAALLGLPLCVLGGHAPQLLAGDQSTPTRQQVEYFEAKVRPLLVTHCYQCHSATSEKLQAGLYLDNRKDLLIGGDSGPAIVPGKPDESLLLSAVRYESFEMPPKGKLSEQQITILEKWIADGAPWPREVRHAPRTREGFDLEGRMRSHWSWQPLRSTQLPNVVNTDWALNEIDRFILVRLESAGLPPAPEADRRQLIRRLSFDLIGLPPTPDEVRAFVRDTDPSAYANLVDRLLKSKHFGEKWARHWLDLVRYGETCGHEFDYPLPSAYQYRDYVIRAFNADVPYDQWVREHFAGDLLTNPRRHPQEGYNESIIGTGFWFLGEAVHAPTDVRADEADRIDNQIDVACKTFFGLTVACARCHDHKFDPILTSDYYALAGFLQSSRRQDAMLDPHGRIARQAQRLDALRVEGDDLMRGVSRPASSLAEYLLAAWAVKHDGQSLESVASSRGLEPQRLASLYTALDDAKLDRVSHPLYLWRRLAWDTDVSDVEFTQACRELRNEIAEAQQTFEEAQGQIEWFADFAQDGPAGWYVAGEAFAHQPSALTRWNTRAERPQFTSPGWVDSGQRGRRLQGVLRSPTFELRHRRIHYRVNAANAKIRLIVDGYVMDVFNALLFQDITLEEVDTGGESRWVTQQKDLDHYLGHRAHLEIIDDGDGFAAVERIGFSDGPPSPDPPHSLTLALLEQDHWGSIEQLATYYENRMAEAMTNAHSNALTSAQVDLLNWLLGANLLSVDQVGLASVSAQFRELDRQTPPPVRVMALVDGDGEDERIHIRGNHLNLGEVVARRVPVAIGGPHQPAISSGSGRLELAERLIAVDNPFTSRVMVNRLWHHLMGRGIVESVDDFGAMGTPPSHPALLDWLAQDFVAHGWSIKHVIRKIVTSRTYRISSRLPAADVIERDANNVLLHRARVRRLPAESIRDAMLKIAGNLNRAMYGESVPVHLTSFMDGRGRPPSGPLDGGGRRSIYVRIQRNFLSPMMLAFDMPSPFNTMGRRNSSNVPAQSLIMMNDPFVWHQAETWAKRLLSNTRLAKQSRLRMAFEEGIGRQPNEPEMDRLSQFVDRQKQLYDCDVDDLRVWTDVCHAIMNLKEFIYLN